MMLGAVGALRRLRDGLRERAALRRLPPPAIDLSSLRVTRGESFRVQMAWVPDAEWADVVTRTAALGITDRAAGVNPGDRRALYYLVRHVKPRRVLEIGTHIGASTVHIALALERNGAAGSRLVTVDVADLNDPARQLWRQYGAEMSPRESAQALGVAATVDFVVMPSLSFLATTTEVYDLIFLDGDHSAATVYQEVPAALRRLRPGGLILMHDYFPDKRPLWPDGVVIEGPWLALERLRGKAGTLVPSPLGALPWPTKQGSNVTSLAVLRRSE